MRILAFAVTKCPKSFGIRIVQLHTLSTQLTKDLTSYEDVTDL